MINLVIYAPDVFMFNVSVCFWCYCSLFITVQTCCCIDSFCERFDLNSNIFLDKLIKTSCGIQTNLLIGNICVYMLVMCVIGSKNHMHVRDSMKKDRGRRISTFSIYACMLHFDDSSYPPWCACMCVCRDLLRISSPALKWGRLSSNLDSNNKLRWSSDEILMFKRCLTFILLFLK